MRDIQEELGVRRLGHSPLDEMVRRRLQEILVAGGFRERAVGVEILWWLPKEFIEAYEKLFLRALELGDGSTMGAMKGDEGRIQKSKSRAIKNTGGMKVGKDGKMTPGPEGRTTAGDEGLGGGGGGKRFYKGEFIIKDEEALEIKEKVDRRLVKLVARVEGMVRQENLVEAQGGSRGSTPGRDVLGVLVEKKMGDQVRRVCRDCGRFASNDWARCPYPHA